MKDVEWQQLVAVIRGERLQPLPTGFIIDSPWIPHWAGYPMLDYFVSEKVWLEANLAAVQAFPDALLLPGFWSEYGMCTEPSAFGAVSVWAEDEFPFAKKVLRSAQEVDALERPNPRQDGLLPWVIRRLKRLQPEIERTGHKIRFAVARGPLNIASFLLGTTEFLTALRTEPERMQQLLGMITDFLLDWIAWQRESFPSIDGILLLDDLVGFIGPQDFLAFALPQLKRIFAADVTVKFFHNDAPCKVCAPHLPEMGVNLLNFGVQHSLAVMRNWTGGNVTLLGNLPPRDVLAQGTPEEVSRTVAAMLAAVPDLSHLIVSCGGGMPPGAPTENIRALIRSVRELTH
jgi:uroporphyrinogen decarboxylase